MPKKKTVKAAAKRFRMSSSGRIKYKHAGAGHLLTSKTRKRKRQLRKTGVLSRPEEKRITKLLSV